jgi:hypothetical protein
MTVMRRSTIYALHDPETGELRYIGKTHNTLAMRISEHRCNALRWRNHFYNWVRALRERGLRPTASVLEVIEAGGTWQAIGDRQTSSPHSGGVGQAFGKPATVL